MSHANVRSLVSQFRSAVEQPRIYAYQFFENLKNEIDIECQTIMDKSNQDRMLSQQAMLIDRVNQHQSACLDELSESVFADRACEYQLTIVQIEAELKSFQQMN